VSAIQVMVHVARLPGGARKVTKISEVTGMEGDAVGIHDLFIFKQFGVDDQGNAQGYFTATGNRPQLLDKLHIAGSRLPPELFESRILVPDDGE
jgi:pilus assembly protein CpaF